MVGDVAGSVMDWLLHLSWQGWAFLGLLGVYIAGRELLHRKTGK